MNSATTFNNVCNVGDCTIYLGLLSDFIMCQRHQIKRATPFTKGKKLTLSPVDLKKENM